MLSQKRTKSIITTLRGGEAPLFFEAFTIDWFFVVKDFGFPVGRKVPKANCVENSVTIENTFPDTDNRGVGWIADSRNYWMACACFRPACCLPACFLPASSVRAKAPPNTTGRTTHNAKTNFR